jgi:predicted patatin/cPLA2 family phospholipase
MTRTEIDEKLQELETMKHRLELETLMMSKEAYERGGKAWLNFCKRMQRQSMIWSSVRQEIHDLYRQRAVLDEADEKHTETEKDYKNSECLGVRHENSYHSGRSQHDDTGSS